MRFLTHNNDPKIVCYGSLKGYLDVPASKIVEVFGPPLIDHYADKTDWQWYIEFEDGHKAEIYNYKDGPSYGFSSTIDSPRVWHVGGKDPIIMKHLRELLGCKYEPASVSKNGSV